jgi:glycosyltransferase involved in cell wall biosynthesis
MPLYNHARYLSRTLASIEAQTLKPCELIVVDDGSSDEGAAIVTDFARHAGFAVVLVRQANAGADVAINRGMALAGGGIVAVINSDDAYRPERLERLVAALEASNSVPWVARYEAEARVERVGFVDERIEFAGERAASADEKVEVLQ